MADPSDFDEISGRPPEAAPSQLIPLSFEQALGAIAMGLIAVISIANVIVRYATNVSFAFTEEFSIVLLVVMTFAGAGLAAARDTNIRIVWFRDRAPVPLRRLLDIAVALASLLMFALVLWYGARLTHDQWDFGETSPGLGYPTWIYTIFMPLLAGLVLYRILGRAAFDLIRRPPNGATPPPER